jgi:hypothetical protein
MKKGERIAMEKKRIKKRRGQIREKDIQNGMRAEDDAKEEGLSH